MNKDKLIPIDFSRNITPPIYGDHVWDELRKYSFHISKENLIKICERESNDNLFVISFADRPNTGKQPVDEFCVVDYSYYRVNEDLWTSTIKASQVAWSERATVKSWKPNHAAMLKQWQAEQLENVASDRLANLNEDNLISHDDMLAKFDKPTFTQAMADAGEFPAVGVECILHLPFESPRVLITYQGDGVGCYVNLSNNKEYSCAHNSVTFKPIQTAEDKAIKDIQMYNSFKTVDFVDAIKAGKVHGIKWVGSE